MANSTLNGRRPFGLADLVVTRVITAPLGPLSASVSRDDSVRANNGAYVGLGEEY